MPNGRVKRFSRVRGYGLLTQDGGEDVFVHWSAIRGGGQTLEKGQKVQFEVVQRPKESSSRACQLFGQLSFRRWYFMRNRILFSLILTLALIAFFWTARRLLTEAKNPMPSSGAESVMENREAGIGLPLSL